MTDQIDKAPTMSEIEIRDAYTVTMHAIEAAGAEYAGIECADKAGYELARVAIGNCRTMRGAVEGTRKILKADSLAYGRNVDAAAKELKDAILAIETPLKVKKAVIDDEKAAAREAKKAEARAKVEAELAAEREAEKARAAEALAELQRQQAESARIAAEATARAEAAEQTLEQERAQAKKEKAAAEASAKAEQEAADRAAALEAMRPDADKLAAYAIALLDVEQPELDTKEGVAILAVANHNLHEIAAALKEPS